MRKGRFGTGWRIVFSAAMSLALTGNYLALAQPQSRQTGPARDRPDANTTVSEPSAAPATAHALACDESFAKDSSHFKLAMHFGFTNVTSTEVEANDGTKVAASVIFPDVPKQRLEVWWMKPHSGIYLIVVTGESDWTAPGGLRLGLTLAELEKLNRKGFKLKGFDKNGVATVKDWNGGELASLPGGCEAGLTLRADPKVSAKIIGALSPNKEYASSNPQMRAAKSTVSEIMIGYPDNAPATEAAPQPTTQHAPANEAAPQPPTQQRATEAAPQPLTQEQASQDCWMETEHGAKSLPLEKRAKIVDKCVKDKMSGAK